VARAGYLGEPARRSLATVVDTVELARYARPGTSLTVDLEPLTRSVISDVARTRSWRHRARALMLPGDARRWWGRAGMSLRSAPRAVRERIRRR
jgi:hypothetical protein